MKNTYIGGHIERVEDLRFLRGRGQFIADLDRARPVARGDPAEAPSRTAGSSRSIRLSARAAPGVHAVVTARDIGRPLPTIPFRRPIPAIMPYAQPVIADQLVRYVGEPVAMVLADSRERAEDALSAIELDIDPLPPVLDAKAGEGGRGEAVRFADRELRLRCSPQRRAMRTTRSAPRFHIQRGAVPRAAHDGAADGDARPARRVGRGATSG